MLWTPQNSVNLEELDAQHRYFFALLDQIETAAKARDNQRFPVLIEELLRYTKYHFASETALMDSYGYVGKTHREEHANLLRRVESMLDETNFRPAALRLFMYTWIVSHIQIEDLELARFVSKKRAEILGD